MELNNKGQLGVYETLIIVVLLACLGGVGYLYMHKPTNSQIYQADSKPKVTDSSFACSPFSCCNEKVDEFMEGKINAVTNKTSN